MESSVTRRVVRVSSYVVQLINICVFPGKDRHGQESFPQHIEELRYVSNLFDCLSFRVLIEDDIDFLKIFLKINVFALISNRFIRKRVATVCTIIAEKHLLRPKKVVLIYFLS